MKVQLDFLKTLKAWETKTDSSTEKLVLAAACSFANGEDRLWASVGSLCRRTQLSERAVQRAIGTLISKKLLILEKEGGGRHQVNFYRVSINPATETPYNKPCMPANGVSLSRNPVTQSEKGVSVAPHLHLTAMNCKGEGKAPRKFVSELNAQIQTATKEIDRLKDQDPEGNREAIVALAKKRKQWKSELLSL